MSDPTTTTAIPADWDVADPSTWTLSTTVDAHMGYHHTGGVMREYREIRHAASDMHAGELDGPEWDAAAAEERLGHAEWWADVLAAIHGVDVAMAEASPEALVAAAESLGLGTDPELGVFAADAIGGYLADANDLEDGAAKARRVAAALEGA